MRAEQARRIARHSLHQGKRFHSGCPMKPQNCRCRCYVCVSHRVMASRRRKTDGAKGNV